MRNTLLYTSHLETLKLVIRFVTSIVLGIAYGRRILDLNDEMVTLNHKSILGR